MILYLCNTPESREGSKFASYLSAVLDRYGYMARISRRVEIQETSNRQHCKFRVFNQNLEKG